MSFEVVVENNMVQGDEHFRAIALTGSVKFSEYIL
jgi:hypothetical protein